MVSSNALSKLIDYGLAGVDENAVLLNEVSQKIWEKPELCFEEKYAHEILTSFLETQGFKVSRQNPLETAFIAKSGHEDGIKVGVMCEYDALPGIGHACGHNLIAEAGLAAAIGLKAILDAHPDVKAQIVVFGTPAEEGGGGKIDMINKKCFDDVDFCMMVHPGPIDLVDFEALSVCRFSIVYHGKEAHAAGAPWLGVNALDAAVQCYNNISMLRQQTLPTCRIHGIVSDGGVKPNIIPQRSELEYYVRAPDDKLREELFTKVVGCAKAAATATGCTVDINREEKPYSNMKRNKVLNDLYKKYAMSLGFTFPDNKNLPGQEKSFAASTDMGNVSYVKPSIHPIYKISSAFNHTEEFTVVAGAHDAQKPTLDSAKAMMMMAIELITDSQLLQSAKTEFAQS